MGSLGISLATMVANLSAHKRGWDQRWKEFSDWAEKGQKIKDELLSLVDEDTNAFNKIMEAFSLPKSSDKEAKIRSEAIQNATKYATEVPLKTMILAYSSFPIIKAMAEIGNPNSISDAGVGALCARSAVIGAYMNVRINAAELKDEVFKKEILAKAEKIKNDSIKEEEAILKIIYKTI